MFCPNCGQKTVDGAKFCFGCGSALNFVQQPEAPKQPEAPQPPEAPKPVYEAPKPPVYEAPKPPVYEAPQRPVYQAPQQPNYYSAPQQPYNPYAPQNAPAPKPKKKKTLWIVLAIILVAAAIGVALYFILGHDSDSGGSGSRQDDPGRMAEEFVEAAFDGDRRTVENYLHSELRDEADYYLFEDGDIEDFELLDVETVEVYEDREYAAELQEWFEEIGVDDQVDTVYVVGLEMTAEYMGEEDTDDCAAYIAEIDGKLYVIELDS